MCSPNQRIAWKLTGMLTDRFRFLFQEAWAKTFSSSQLYGKLLPISWNEVLFHMGTSDQAWGHSTIDDDWNCTHIWDRDGILNSSLPLEEGVQLDTTSYCVCCDRRRQWSFPIQALVNNFQNDQKCSVSFSNVYCSKNIFVLVQTALRKCYQYFFFYYKDVYCSQVYPEVGESFYERKCFDVSSIQAQQIWSYLRVFPCHILPSRVFLICFILIIFKCFSSYYIKRSTLITISIWN